MKRSSALALILLSSLVVALPHAQADRSIQSRRSTFPVRVPAKARARLLVGLPPTARLPDGTPMRTT